MCCEPYAFPLFQISNSETVSSLYTFSLLQWWHTKWLHGLIHSLMFIWAGIVSLLSFDSLMMFDFVPMMNIYTPPSPTVPRAVQIVTFQKCLHVKSSIHCPFTNIFTIQVIADAMLSFIKFKTKQNKNPEFKQNKSHKFYYMFSIMLNDSTASDKPKKKNKKN